MTTEPADFTTCDLFDADESLQSCAVQFQNLGGRPRFTGPVRTVRCHRDNGLVKQILNSPETAPCWWWMAQAPWSRR